MNSEMGFFSLSCEAQASDIAILQMIRGELAIRRGCRAANLYSVGLFGSRP